MSKSKKEKSRIEAIKQYINNEIPFSPELLRIKIKFICRIKNKNKSEKNFRISTKVQNIEKNVREKYRELFFKILLPIAEKNYIFDLTVNLSILITDTPSISVSISHNNAFLCYIKINNKSHITYETEIFNLNNFLKESLIDFKKRIQEHCFLRMILISKSFNTKRYHLNKKAYQYLLHKTFKKFNFYKNIMNYTSFIYKHNNIFKFITFGAVYNLTDNIFEKIYIVNEHDQDLSLAKQNIFNNNLEILKSLKLMNILKFDIEGMNEEQILEMHELLNY